MTTLTLLDKDFCANPDQAWTLPAFYYTSPQVFANEVTKIFEKDWFCVAHLSDVSENNSYITRRILDESIVIIRGKDAVLRAFYNVCPHRGHQILQGEGKAKNVLTCPYHAWSFRLDGAMVNAPNADKVCDFDAADFHLSEISVAEYAGFVFLNLDPQARPVEEQLPGFAEKLHEACNVIGSLKRVMRLETETPANWKTIVDNYQECYHCPTNHVSFADSVQVDHYEHLLFKNWSLQVGLARSSEKSFKIDSNIENPKFSGFYTWPCTMFNVAPSEDFMTVIYEFPLNTETTLQIYDVYMLNEDLSDEQQSLLTWYKEVFRPEDLRLVESVQKGLKSRGYPKKGGRIMTDRDRGGLSEHGIAYFHNLVAQRNAEA